MLVHALLISTATFGGADAAAAPVLPTLTESQQHRLETAHDGRDHREEAFVALAEHVAEWSVDAVRAEAIRNPTPDDLTEDPDAYRGEAFRLTGTLAQQRRLPSPHEQMLEWFIRDGEDRPILIYVYAPEGEETSATSAAIEVREEQRIEVVARFYKRVDFVARDGEERSYAAFVGAYPERLNGALPPGRAMTMLLAILVLGLAFLILVWSIRRQRRQRSDPRFRRGITAEERNPELDDAKDLPEDPADALAELRRRAQGGK